MSKKVFFHAVNDGCEQNNYNGSLILDFFIRNGYLIADKPSGADFIIINICGVDEFREKKSLKTLRFFLKKYGRGRTIVVTACLAVADYIKEIPNVVRIGPKDLNKFNDLIDAKVPIEKARVNNIIVGDKGYGIGVFHILLSRGCMGECNYCFIKRAKGTVTSEPLGDVLKEFRRGLKMGYKKFALLGDELGCYGIDIGSDLIVLLKRVCNEKGDFKLMLTNLDPGWFMRLQSRLLDIIKLGKIDWINLPIQSTSNRLVKLMGRKYDVDKVIDVVRGIKSHYDIKFYTDILIGYPTETMEEFLDSFKIIELFDMINFNVFSERPGTRACSIVPKVSKKGLRERIELIEELKLKYPDKKIIHSLEDV
jgi:MiaB/RimO family radical SAM methylthiotransferase